VRGGFSNPVRVFSLPRVGGWRAAALAVNMCVLLTCLPISVAQETAAGESAVQFTNITAEAGIDFHLTCGSSADKLYIPETMCGGVAFFDYDNDGWMDLLLVNGSTQELAAENGGPPSKLYRNKGDGTFLDVTAESALSFRGWGMGVTVGDFDNDGWSDVYLTHFRGGLLYRNQGDGTFQDVTSEAGVANQGRWGTSAAFGDYDNDGHLDLYVANYVQFDVNNLPDPGSGVCRYRGITVYCGPRGLPGERDRLYRNNGDGSFTDVTEKLSIDSGSYYGLGVLWWDYDLDGDLDLYVANDSTPSLLYSNDGDGTFDEIGVITGLALSADGREQAGMGVDAGDYDNDGRPDLIKTNFSDDTNNLYHNDGDGWFSDLGGAAGFARISFPLLGFGIRFLDYDNDGWKDIYVANGHVYPQVDNYSFGTTYAQRAFLFHNLQNGRFEEVGLTSGAALKLRRVSRGLASADFDNDGDLDLLETNLDDQPLLLRNEAGNQGHWIRLGLIGTSSNRDGYGARVTIVAGGLSQTDEVRASTSYLSSNDPRVHFGLGKETEIQLVEIRWPSGKVDKMTNVKVDMEIVVEEGRGIVDRR
jgi:hypothetical protein